MRHFLLLALTFSAIFASGKALTVNRIDPPFWWVGMKTSEVELLLVGEDFLDTKVSVNYPGVSVLNVEVAANKAYLYLTLDISADCQPGMIPLELSQGRKGRVVEYELKSRSHSRPLGLDGSDTMYLIMPDRFSNGDESNDEIPGMNEPALNRSHMFGRHGGDLAGIVNHLDYLNDLGVTALWINPLLENDQPEESYHGYAATDCYDIDARFGTLNDYEFLINDLHSRDMKIVMDVVYNHWGNEHYLFKSPPDSSWFNFQDEFKRTSYRAPTLLDPHASDADREIMTDGWFDHHMPDINQRDPHVSAYMIQNSIWWIEQCSIDAFRIDTYAYPDQRFMSDLGARLKQEYPTLFFFGETWVHGTFIQDWFLRSDEVNGLPASNLPAVTDFQLYYAINDALTGATAWEKGINKIYYTLAADVIYEHPEKLVTFLDNHDLSRFYSMVGEDLIKFKQGLGMLFTLRGIPCMYYGTEILMKNYADPDGKVREEFPGGWPNHEVNKFHVNGRSAVEQEAFNFIQTILNWRKDNSWIADAPLKHFVPEETSYVYFRESERETLMVAVNVGSETIELDIDRFEECIPSPLFSDVISGEPGKLGAILSLEPGAFRMLHFHK
jgi:glycosidase